MLFRIDADAHLSLAEQIAMQIRSGISSGDLRPGERLPAARELAVSLQINMHTVLRAYTLLRDEGLIGMRQGRGAWVSEQASAGLLKVNELMAQLVDEAKKMGLTPQELAQMVAKA
jgi:GntR family transcriptional regulator